MVPIPPIRPRRALLRVLSAMCMVAALVVTTPLPSGAAVEPVGPLSPPSGAWFGGTVNPNPNDGVNGGMAEINARESFLGRTYDIINRFYGFNVAIPTSLENWDVSKGRYPMITWGAPADTIQLRNGTHDAWLRQQADRMAAFDSPIFLRFYHEMEGGYRQSYVHSPADFIAAWRHVHDIFVQRGATNVVWIWSPTAWSFVTRSPWPPNYYPGDAYVDWIAADGYSWFPFQSTPWRSWSTIFQDFYDWAETKDKPIMIAENAAMEDPQQPGRKAAWITSSQQLIKSIYPRIQAVMYFDNLYTKGGYTYTWQVDTSQSSYNAYRAMGADPYFSPSHRGGGGGGAIPPGRYAIGDSVMLGASQELRGKDIRVNASASRQFPALPGLIRSLRSSGALRKTVIIHVGNHGSIDLADCKDAVIAAKKRTVYLVTVKVPKPWGQANNRTLARCDRAYPRAHLVDWFGHSVQHPAWFAKDRYHLTPMGQRRYAGLISNRTR